MINNLYIKATPTTAAVTWGSITGTLSDQTDLQTALNAKQATLVSGTNIKTLEGQSLLGSGNIDLTKSDVGLANVDNTSDLNKPISTATQTALNAKQATLVSGTNIKTINGNSVLGSGDLTIGASASWGGITGTLSSQTDLQTALNAKQNTLTLTTTGTSGAATLVGSTLNIPQYSGGGGGTSNPSVVAISAQDGTPVIGNGLGIEQIGLSLLVPSGTFTGNGLLELRYRVLASGTLGNYFVRIYKNTTSSLTGATLIGTTFFNASTLSHGAFRTFTINSNTIKGLNATTTAITDIINSSTSESSTTFTTSADNYIIIALQLSVSGTIVTVKSAMLNKYI